MPEKKKAPMPADLQERYAKFAEASITGFLGSRSLHDILIESDSTARMAVTLSFDYADRMLKEWLERVGRE